MKLLKRSVRLLVLMLGSGARGGCFGAEALRDEIVALIAKLAERGYRQSSITGGKLWIVGSPKALCRAVLLPKEMVLLT